MTLPPYAETLGVRIKDDGDGRCVVMPAGDHVLGRPGFIHGGALAGLLEIAAIVAVRDALAGEDLPRLKPVTVTVDFRRGGRMVETRAMGTVTRLGNRIANVDAAAWQDGRDRPIATARMNILLDRKES
ncbi:PaaI family thioesterase [Sphingomonas profundi]|uniref:PaaI family thioesterase n=1 Tax=Alterirhizorhabdus profundi TaxID=2681549 RepID=UPI0012E94EF4|nr:PaaI family thioesterase [Sphingomonas profundi]